MHPGASQPPIGTPAEPTLYTIGVHILTAWYVPLVHATGMLWKEPGRCRVINSSRHTAAHPTTALPQSPRPQHPESVLFAVFGALGQPHPAPARGPAHDPDQSALWGHCKLRSCLWGRHTNSMVGTPEHENMHISITTFRHISTFLTYTYSKNDVNPCLVIFITYKYIVRFHRYVRSNDFWVREWSSEPDFGSRVVQGRVQG